MFTAIISSASPMTRSYCYIAVLRMHIVPVPAFELGSGPGLAWSSSRSSPTEKTLIQPQQQQPSLEVCHP